MNRDILRWSVKVQDDLNQLIGELDLQPEAEEYLKMRAIRLCNDIREINRKGYAKWKSDQVAPSTPE